jgi:broad specificity phosphatase PhoE
MSRRLRTAEISAEPLGSKVQAMDALIDIDHGQWQGLSPERARAGWPEEIDLWYRRPDLVRAQALSRYWLLAQAPCAINEIDATPGSLLVRSVTETGHLGAPQVPGRGANAGSRGD